MSSAESLEQFGIELRQAREAQSRTLEEIAERTKIHRRHLESIENGQLQNLPKDPYRIAFYRSYALALGVPLPVALGGPGHATRAAASHGVSSTSTTPDPKQVIPTSTKPSFPNAAQRATRETARIVGETARFAGETARFANTAAKSALKTTEHVVRNVGSGAKDTFETFTSKGLWEEAEQVRRERRGLPPKEEVTVPMDSPAATNVSPAVKESSAFNSEKSEESTHASTSRFHLSTNVVIAILVVLFASAAFYVLRIAKRDSAPSAVSLNREVIPEPVDKPKTLEPSPSSVTHSSPAIIPATAANDSLQFQLLASAPVWVSISPDGLAGFRGELKPGEQKSFSAGQKFVVNLGNQKAVKMTFNGTALSHLPTIANSGIVVRDLVLTRDRVMLGGKEVPLTNPAAKISSVNPSAPVSNTGTVSHTAVIPKPINSTKALPKSTIAKSPTPPHVNPKPGGANVSPQKSSKTSLKGPIKKKIVPIEPIPARP